MKIFVKSKRAFNEFMKEQSIDDSNVESFDAYAFISILDVVGLDCDGWFEKDHDNVLTLYFGDYGEPEKECEPGPGHFSTYHAKKIINFVEKHKDKQIMMVHCTAGISRSGAVGAFINDLYGNSYKEFINDNKQIQPNPYVSRILNQEYRKKLANNSK
jgi:predicted protein tyrosine phosphatase